MSKSKVTDRVPAPNIQHQPLMFACYIAVVIVMSLGWYFGTRWLGNADWSLFQCIVVTILIGVVFQLKSVLVLLNGIAYFEAEKAVLRDKQAKEKLTEEAEAAASVLRSRSRSGG